MYPIRHPLLDLAGFPGGPARQQGRGLESLPDEILLTVAKDFECARDLSSLGRSARRLKQCVDSSSAWQDFVRMKFPFTTIPPKSGNHDYKALAESLTYQSRCWDRRSIRFTGMYPAQQTQRRHTSLAFQPVIDVDYDMDSGREMVVWGAGEDIVARYRHKAKGQRQQASVSWRQHLGGEHGLRGGRDDVQTMDIVKLPHLLKGPAILVGRQNGDLSLLSAQSDHNFGQQLADFSPSHPGGPVVAAEGEEPLRQQQIMSVDVFDDSNQGLVAACNNLGVSVYQLPQDNNTTSIPPVALYDPQTTQQLWNAKWMGSNNLLALAFRGTEDPLRYLTITPTGWTVTAAAKNARVVDEFLLRNTSVYGTSLQPLHRYPGMTDPTPLLLSSWKDGTIR